MIEVTNLVKKYGKHTAVNNISFTVNKGEILGFLGPNGAGKSTTMNMLTGYLSSTSGSIKISGIDILENPIEAKKHIGYLPEIPPLYMDMTVYDYLTFVAKLKKVSKANMKAHLADILDRIELTLVQNRLIRNLSKGYKQRVGLASALIGSPDVLILDEPTVGLDPKQIIEMRNLIKELSKQHTIILSSHILPEISAICDAIMIINKGTMVALDTPDNLKHLFSNNFITVLRVRSPKADFMDQLKAIEGVKDVTQLEEVEENAVDFSITSDKVYDIRENVFNLCAKQGTPLLMMKSEDASLEDIFLKATEQANEQLEQTASDEAAATLENENAPSNEEISSTKLNKEGVIDENNIN